MVGGHLKVTVAAKSNIAVVCHFITSRRLIIIIILAEMAVF